jgi:polysaccharide pyruvyl transferase CsaB
MPRKLLLAGYIGCGNLGDDAMAAGFVSALGEGYQISVLSGDPGATNRNMGWHALPRKDMAAVDNAIKACDALVFPGGSVFQDVTSVRSVAYYARLVKQAKGAGKKVFLLGQGVGPLTRWMGKRMAAAAFNAADVVAVRDSTSAVLLKELGVRRPAKITADPAFLLPKPELRPGESFEVAGMRAVGLAPRRVKGVDVVGLFGEVAKLLFAEGIMPMFIAMDRNEDPTLIEEIASKHGGKMPDLKKLDTPRQVQDRMARMDAVLALRLHAGILAATVGVPPMMVSYDPKVDAFAKQLGLGSATKLQGANAASLARSFLQFLQNKERNAATVELKRNELATQALGNVTLLRENLPAS